MATNPMHQFNVYRIGPEIKLGEIDISFTNASLFMVISSITILLIFNLGSKKNLLIPNKMQLLAELSYTFISKMISDTAGSKGKPYFLWSEDHFHEMNEKSILALIERAGFRVIRKEEIRIHPFKFYFTGIRPLLRFIFEKHLLLELTHQ